MTSNNEEAHVKTWFRRLRRFPATGYAAAQLPILVFFAFFLFDALSKVHPPFPLDRTLEGMGTTLLLSSMFALPPAPLVGVLDGLSQRARRRVWRIAASVPVLVLGRWNAVAGVLSATIAFGVLPDGSRDPLPLVPFLAALIVVEVSLALSWGVASLVSRIGRGGHEIPPS